MRRRFADRTVVASRTGGTGAPDSRLFAAADITDEAPKLTAARIQELESLKARAEVRYEAGEVDEAIRIWEMIRMEAPDFGDVGSRLSQEYLSRGMEPCGGPTG